MPVYLKKKKKKKTVTPTHNPSKWLPSAYRTQSARPWPTPSSFAALRGPSFCPQAYHTKITALHHSLCPCCSLRPVSVCHNLVTSQPLVTSLERPCLVTLSDVLSPFHSQSPYLQPKKILMGMLFIPLSSLLCDIHHYVR